jgi:tryptophan-rich sensory protein
MNSDLEEPTSADIKGWIAPLGWFTLVYFISFLGYLGGSQGLWFWYVSLRRPDWGIPGWGFTIAWTFIYGVVASASWQVKQSLPSGPRTTSLILCGLLIGSSAIWPWVFFAWHQQKGGFIFAAIIAALSLVSVFPFWKTRPSAGGLMLVQLFWAVYVSILCLAVWQGNLQ